jgi:hypothetical protein
MTYKTGPASSDSVNLGSNPSPPATANADVSGISRTSSASEKSEIPEQTAHTGRTETGTVEREWTQDEIDEDNEYEDDEDGLDDECGLMGDGQCTMAGTEHCDFSCPNRDSEDFCGSAAWRKKHAARSAPPFAGWPR